MTKMLFTGAVVTWYSSSVRNVSKLLCDCTDVMLGADSVDQSQTSDQPQVARKDVVD